MVLFAAAVTVVGAAALFPLNRWALALVQWVQGAGVVGAGTYGLTYVLATLLMVPGAVLTAGAGFLYGPVFGTALVSPVSVVAATLAFILGRTAARSWVARRAGADSRLAAIDQAVGRDGFKIVLLLRLSPIVPYNLLNYLLGLTRIRLRDYLLASFVGMFPGTFLYVYLGSLVTSASEVMSGAWPDEGPWAQVLYWGGLVATLAVTVLITRTARRALSRALAVPPAGIVPAGNEVAP